MARASFSFSPVSRAFLYCFVAFILWVLSLRAAPKTRTRCVDVLRRSQDRRRWHIAASKYLPGRNGGCGGASDCRSGVGSLLHMRGHDRGVAQKSARRPEGQGPTLGVPFPSCFLARWNDDVAPSVPNARSHTWLLSFYMAHAIVFLRGRVGDFPRRRDQLDISRRRAQSRAFSAFALIANK